MSVIDKLLGLLVPHECLGCGLDGSLLCSGCLSMLPTTAIPARPNSQLQKIQAATLYEGLAKGLIWKLKSDGARAAAETMARRMSHLINTDNAYLVPVPTATSRVRQRGYDQAKLLARALARQTGLPYLSCLARHGQAHQVGAHRNERLQQLHGALRVKKPTSVCGAHIILIDDVTTTGATLETAATLLNQAGAAQVEALTFAYKPKES